MTERTQQAKINIAVLFGGRSGEHAVSLESVKFVLRNLHPEKYNVIPVGISRQGEWFTGEGVLGAMLSKDYSQLTPAALLPVPGALALYTIEGEGKLTPLADVDVVFPVLHGPFGEDGTIQGLFEMADLAYVGAGVTGSAVGMDKYIFYNLMRAHQIPVIDSILVLRTEIEAGIEAVINNVEQLGDYPYFVKPANLGSSVGISKVRSRSDLLEGLMDAASYDRRIVVQKGLNVREIEVSVMGNDQPRASICGEVLPGEEFYSYEAKYHDETSKTVIPAGIPNQVAEEIRSYAVQAFKACDLAGLARVDFFIERETGRVYLNELNTIPGFTQISMYPMLWEASGVSNMDLIDQLVGYALERKAQRDATKRSYTRGEA